MKKETNPYLEIAKATADIVRFYKTAIEKGIKEAEKEIKEKLTTQKKI